MNVNFPPNWHGPEETGAARTPTKVEQAAKDYVTTREELRAFDDEHPTDFITKRTRLLDAAAKAYDALKQALAEAGL